MRRSITRNMPSRSPWVVWLAVCLMVFAALAPTLSHALAAARSTADRQEICTSAGPQWVASTNSVSSKEVPAGPTSLVLMHCPFCLHPADRDAAPPPQLPYLFLVQGGNQEPSVWQAFFFLVIPSYAPPPRGPPSAI